MEFVIVNEKEGLLLRFGIDMDSTLLEPNWEVVYNRNIVAHCHTQSCVRPPTWQYYVDLCTQCLEECVNDPDILDLATLREGAKEVLGTIRQDNELWLVSHRPPSLTLAGINVLKRLGVYEYFNTVIWSMESKLVTCRKYGLDVLIDDGPLNILELEGTEIVPVIMDQPYNRYLPSTILRAYDWSDVIRLSKDIDERVTRKEISMEHPRYNTIGVSTS